MSKIAGPHTSASDVWPPHRMDSQENRELPMVLNLRSVLVLPSDRADLTQFSVGRFFSLVLAQQVAYQQMPILCIVKYLLFE